MNYTVNDIMTLKPCYSRDKVEDLWAGRESLTLSEIADLDISLEDRRWVIIRLSPPSQALLHRWVERAIRRVDRDIAGEVMVQIQEMIEEVAIVRREGGGV